VARLPFILAALCLLSGAAPATSASGPPNIVVVMVDDMPALDGRLIQAMPNTRALFADGVRLTNFHSETPLCCPARVGFLTGQHTLNHGVDRNGPTQFKPQMTLATQLHALGYYTSIVGKYLNRYTQIAGSTAPGWDDFLVFGEPAYYDYDLYSNGVSLPVEHHGRLPGDYSTDVIADRAASFIANAPARRPLFAWIAPNAPHNPSTPAPRHASAPCSVAPWKPPNYDEQDVSDKPLYVQEETFKPPAAGSRLTATCRILLAVDDLVGRVRNALGPRLANTIFVFSGDNGMNLGEHGLNGKEAPYVTEIPFLLRWPAVSARTVSARLHNIDFAPTICEIAGCTLGPYPNGQAHPDGLSFAPVLSGGAPPARDAVLTDLPYAVGVGVPAWYSVSTADWHYTEYASGEKELYDIRNGPCWAWVPTMGGDPCELKNQAGAQELAQVQAALAARLAELKKERG
jgi:N-acetylglucosamine-6-sulfatase